MIQGESLISKGVKVVGEVTCDEDISIEGEFEGKLKVNGRLHVGRNGRVSAEVKVNVISVEGKIKGNISAIEKVHIYPTGQVEGDIQCPAGGLDVDPSAIFVGSVQMIEKKIPAYLESPKDKVKPSENIEDINVSSRSRRK